MRRIAAALTLALLSGKLSTLADTEFAAEQLLFVNNPPSAVLAADLDSDSDLDLVISGDAGLSVMFKLDGGAGFSDRQKIGDARSESERAIDLDADGDADILCVQISGSSRTIVWHRNDDGDFSVAISIRSESSLMTLLEPTDVDGDDDIDLLWYDGRNDIVEWMENSDGAGDFTAPQTLHTIGDLLFPALADLDGDGIPDLVAQDWKGTPLASDDELIWLRGQAAPVLGFEMPQALAGPGTTLLAIGALDAGDSTDLVVAGSPAGTMQWLRNDGGGVFSAPLPIGMLATPPENVSIADIDGDGFRDVLFSQRFGAAEFFRNTNGVGQFASAMPLVSPIDSTFESVVAAELGTDTRLDLITVEATGILLWPQVGEGANFDPPVVLAAAIEDLTDIASADIDSDGDADVLFASQDGKLQTVSNIGNGAFSGASVLLDGEENLERILPVQVDGLGGVDLIALRRDDDLVNWHAGDAAGQFGSAMLIDDFGLLPSAAATADFNGDGSIDLAVAFAGDDVCSWYPQDPATKNFSFRALSGMVSGARAIAAGDVDGDNDPDIVTADFDGRIFVYTNNDGAGNFSAATQVGQAPDGTFQVELADIDGDMSLDILALESSGVDSTVTAFFNGGGGAFPTVENLFTSGSGVRAMAAGDLDQDGDADFVTANNTSDSVSWHKNDGTGMFVPKILNSDASSSPYTVVVYDLDGDGDLDVLNSSRFAGIVGWFRNDFRPPPPNDDPVTVWAWDLGVEEPEVLDLQSDGDGDGYSLLEEFAFNMDPKVHDRTPAVTNGNSGPPRMWFTFGNSTRARGVLIRRKDYQEIGLSYIVELSGDYRTWTPTTTGNGFSVHPDYRRINYNKLVPGRPPRHGQRVRIEYNPPD